MSDYLQRYLAGGRRRTADPALIERWEWEARWQGDSKIKTELSAAKRTSTELRKACGQFGSLRPEHDLALRAAASAMDALVRDLTALTAWAKDYKAFCDLERRQEDAARLESIATKRWGDDPAALQFEIDLMRELDAPEGKDAFAAWCHAHGKYRECGVSQIVSPLDGVGLGDVTDRVSAAKAVRKGMECSSPNRWHGVRGPTVICPWTDHENYLAYRRKLVATAASVVASVASSQRLA